MTDARQTLLAKAHELLPSWFTDRLAGEPARFSLLLDTRHVLVIDGVTGVRQAANGDVWIDVEMLVPFRKDGFPWGHFPVVKTAAPDRAMCSINAARVVAVGTTVTRVLEHLHAADPAQRIAPGLHRGATDIFIHPPYQFGAVGGLLTNFHLPQSTLLMLVCAFAGRDLVLEAYRQAVAQAYRFYSYGDCMLLV